MFKLDLEKAEKPEIKLSTSVKSLKKEDNSRKTFTPASLAMPNPLPVWTTTNCKILKEVGIPDHLTCLLRNLYACQEATVRTRHGTIDWFRIGKGVHQGCVLSPCSFNMQVRLCSKSFPKLKLGFSSMWTKNFQIYKLDFKKAEEPVMKLPTFVGSCRK